MAGLKQIYRASDSFRFPAWDYAISYPENSVVAYYDSDLQTPRWRHYISYVQTTPGSLDSDIRGDEWIEMSFDSEALYQNALKAAAQITPELLAYLEPRLDSDIGIKVDSDLADLRVKIKLQVDSDLNAAITTSNSQDSDKLATFETNLVATVNDLDSDNKKKIDSEIALVNVRLSEQDSDIIYFSQKVNQVYIDNDSDRIRQDERYAGLSQFAFNNHVEIELLKRLSNDKDSDIQQLQNTVAVGFQTIAEHDSDKKRTYIDFADADSDVKALIVASEASIRNDFNSVLSQTTHLDADSDLKVQLSQQIANVQTDFDSDYLGLERALDDVYEQYIRIKNNELNIDSEWVINQFGSTPLDSDWVIGQLTDPSSNLYQAFTDTLNKDTSISLGGADSDWVLRNLVANALDSETLTDAINSFLSNSVVDSEYVQNQFSPSNTNFLNAVQHAYTTLTGNTDFGTVDSDWVLRLITDKTSSVNNDFINSVTEVVNSQIEKGEVASGADSDWVLRNIVSTSIDSELITQTINTIVQQATANSIIDSDWVIRQFQQSSEFEQRVQNIVNQLTSTGNVVDSEYVSQQFTTNNAEFSDAVTNVVNQAIENGLIGQVDSEWVLSLFTAGDSAFDRAVRDVVNNLVNAGELVDSDFVSSQVNNVYDTTSNVYQELVKTLNTDNTINLGADSDWILRSFGTDNIDSEILKGVIDSVLAGSYVDSDWILDQFSDTNSDVYNAFTQAMQGDTSLSLSGPDSDWVISQITENSPPPEADSEWIQKNTFNKISVAGQSDVVASDDGALTLVAGDGVGITTDATAKSVTITSTVNQGLDFGTFNNPAGFTLDMQTF